jgi:hypothetical protein
MTRGRLWAFLLLGLALGTGGPLWAEQTSPIHFVESYAGPHANEFNDLLSQVKSIVPAALAYITVQWGLPNTLHYPMIVRVIDSPSSLPGRPIAAYVRSFISGGELRQELVVDLQHHLMYPDENLENVLYHEMAHAVLQDAVTSPGAAGIPQWFNEGLAQSVTTEGRERTSEDFKRYGHTDSPAILCDLNGNVDAFYHGEYNFGCYTQFYLAVHRLLMRGGKDTVAQVITGLKSGTPLPALVGQVTPLSWAAFQGDVQRYTRSVFSGAEPIP